MSALGFLSPAAASDGAIARSPMERLARRAGAQFEVQGRWNVPVEYAVESAARPVRWADVSHLRKWEVNGERAGGKLGTARRRGAGWVCPLTKGRALVVGSARAPAHALEVTCNYAALTILGPQARETIARFCALDLRPQKAPPHSFWPGSIARQPGMILVEAPEWFLLLFGWATGEYMWTVVEDAARHLGGGPVGVAALAPAGEVAASA